MEQNTIAVIWDFDKTLIYGSMQEPIFKKYHVNPDDFWREVSSLPKRYAKQGVKVNEQTIYLNHLLTCIDQGIFAGLDNRMLAALAKELVFYPGVPDIFISLKNVIEDNPDYRQFGIHVEHFVVSTGFAEMIRGSLVRPFVDGIWGCEFIETPIRSFLDQKTSPKSAQDKKGLRQLGYIIDNTSKTRAIFEINKGADRFDSIDVNSKMEDIDRRVPFQNMIYVADGPSDVPAFSILKQYGGKTFAVYPQGNAGGFKQVDALRKDGRIDMYAEADYSEGTMAYIWLTEKTKEIGESIYRRYVKQIKRSASQPPVHLE